MRPKFFTSSVRGSTFPPWAKWAFFVILRTWVPKDAAEDLGKTSSFEGKPIQIWNGRSCFWDEQKSINFWAGVLEAKDTVDPLPKKVLFGMMSSFLAPKKLAQFRSDVTSSFGQDLDFSTHLRSRFDHVPERRLNAVPQLNREGL